MTCHWDRNTYRRDALEAWVDPVGQQQPGRCAGDRLLLIGLFLLLIIPWSFFAELT